MGDCQSKNRISDVSEPTLEPGQTSNTQPIKELTNESIKKSVKEPVKDPVKKEIQKPDHQPVKELTIEPVSEPAEESAKEPVTEPVTEPVIEPAKEASKTAKREQSPKQNDINQNEQINIIKHKATQAIATKQDSGNQTDPIAESFQEKPSRQKPQYGRSFGKNKKF